MSKTLSPANVGGRPTIYGEETVRTSIRLPKSLSDKIRVLAHETQKNASTVIVEALKAHFE
jgi:predicted DNA-binding protein